MMETLTPNFIHSLLEQSKGPQLSTTIFNDLKAFFNRNEGNVFDVNKHDDSSFELQQLKIRIVKAYKSFVLVSKLDEDTNEELFSTAINYGSLLDCQNQKEEYVWQLVKS